MTYSLRGVTANPEDAVGTVDENQPMEAATLPEDGSNPLVDTSTGPLKVAFWAIVVISFWKWMKK